MIKSILLIDQDRKLARLLSSFLSLEGYRVIYSSTLNDAFKKLDRQNFHLVILDPTFKDVSCEMLLEKLVGSGQKIAPFVMLTPNLDYQIPAEHEEHIAVVLPKPFNPEDLLGYTIHLLNEAKS